MINAALEYARKGWPIFPCVPGEKTPLTKNGVHEATTNIAQIEKWWGQYPDANIALHPYGAGMMVVDLDPGHDRSEILEKFGPEFFKAKLIARTPRGGHHYYFALRPGERFPNSVSKIAHKVDVRCYNGYVLLPPSRTKDGNYGW